ncbi:alginate lyase family protein [Bacillus cereus]|uniref:alginate lyase family protein n=1 Tax=Bacillus cereus TaxID=1396 RepID=UPI00356F73BF
MVRRKWIVHHPIKASYIDFSEFNPDWCFFFQVDEKDNLIRQLSDEQLREMQREADHICKHIFDLLGSGGCYVGERLPWHKDFKVGYEWKRRYYKDIEKINLFNSADVKVPWELSRCYHFFTLGKVYWITQDSKYVEEFMDEVEDWIEENPVEMSVNWTCSMEVAIRAINWMSAYVFFENSPKVTKDFKKKFFQSLYLHGLFIYKNLENKGEYKANHYLTNIVGLIWLGVFFRNLKIVKSNSYQPNVWLKFALKELEKEWSNQVNSDGTNFESSTSYHRLVTEMLLLTVILCKRNGIEISNKYINLLEKMCEFIKDITKGNGLSPMVGDADDGRLLIVSKYGSENKRNFSHILSIAGEFFNRDDFRSYATGHEENALWVCGSFQVVKRKQEHISKAYPNGGYYLLKNNLTYCLIRCGELSVRGRGVHSHNDILSVELNVGGVDFFIDPGTYVYTADYKMRNVFRSTNMHNTIQIYDEEQNNICERLLFSLPEQTFGECILFQNNHFIGKHRGFIDCIHERNIKLESNQIVVKDSFYDKQTLINKVCLFKSHFILDCDVQIYKMKKGWRLFKDGINLQMDVLEGQFSLQECMISRSYGRKIKSKKIVIEGSGKSLTCNIRVLSQRSNDENEKIPFESDEACILQNT